jgi:hypothetical protein
VRDGRLRPIANLSLQDPTDDLVDKSNALIDCTRSNNRIELKVTPGFYEFELQRGGATQRRAQLKADKGSVNVTL